jgi:hypothetical protein
MLDRLRPEHGFAPVSRGAMVGWGGFYALFFLYAATNATGFLFIDFANLMFHEAGHAVFSWCGYYTQILGGTLGELLVPLLCLLVFVRRGETTAVAFSAFWGFENLLYIATYMGDARSAALPLVGSDESDWAILFLHWGMLHLDRTIAAWTRTFGWIGMLATVGWLVWMHLGSEGRRTAGAGTP